MIEQGSPQWIKERIGRLTASRMGDVMDVTKAGKAGAARMAYLRQLVAERMTDTAQEFFVTAAMQWGIDNEQAAADAYEEASGEILERSPFVLHPTIEHFGASPDRLVGDDGLIEIKCPATATYVEWRQTGEIPARYQWQMLAQLACTRRGWCDFVAFDPRVVYGPRLWVKRFEPDAGRISECEDGARAFLAEVDAVFRAVTENSNA